MFTLEDHKEEWPLARYVTLSKFGQKKVRVQTRGFAGWWLLHVFKLVKVQWLVGSIIFTLAMEL